MTRQTGCAAVILMMLAGVVSTSFSGQDRPRGAIRGRVELPRSESSARRPGVAELGAAPHRSHAQPPQAVVYLETAPQGAFEQPPAGRAVMDQRDETFVPHILAITVGTIVDFPNSDRTFHNVFSLSRVRQFDLGRYGVGRSKPVRFDRPGIVRVFCDIHSHMNAFILVFGHPFFSLTDTTGAYRIQGVPPGRYSIVAWHEGDYSDAREVVVPSAGTTEVDFAFP